MSESTITQIKVNGTSHDIEDSYARQSIVELENSKGAPSGIVPLDENGKIDRSYLPDEAIEFLGTWNASANDPLLKDGHGNLGDFYIVSVAGEANFGTTQSPRSVTFAVNDRVIYNENEQWEKLQAGNVNTVNDVVPVDGNVSLIAENIPTIGNNTVQSDINKITQDIADLGALREYIIEADKMVDLSTISYAVYKGAVLTNISHGSSPNILLDYSNADESCFGLYDKTYVIPLQYPTTPVNERFTVYAFDEPTIANKPDNYDGKLKYYTTNELALTTETSASRFSTGDFCFSGNNIQLSNVAAKKLYKITFTNETFSDTLLSYVGQKVKITGKINSIDIINSNSVFFFNKDKNYCLLRLPTYPSNSLEVFGDDYGVTVTDTGKSAVNTTDTSITYDNATFTLFANAGHYPMKDANYATRVGTGVDNNYFDFDKITNAISGAKNLTNATGILKTTNGGTGKDSYNALVNDYGLIAVCSTDANTKAKVVTNFGGFRQAVGTKFRILFTKGSTIADDLTLNILPWGETPLVVSEDLPVIPGNAVFDAIYDGTCYRIEPNFMPPFGCVITHSNADTNGVVQCVSTTSLGSSFMLYVPTTISTNNNKNLSLKINKEQNSHTLFDDKSNIKTIDAGLYLVNATNSGYYISTHNGVSQATYAYTLNTINCETAASTTQKTINHELNDGETCYVYFTNGNSAQNPTLNNRNIYLNNELLSTSNASKLVAGKYLCVVKNNYVYLYLANDFDASNSYTSEYAKAVPGILTVTGFGNNTIYCNTYRLFTGNDTFGYLLYTNTGINYDSNTKVYIQSSYLNVSRTANFRVSGSSSGNLSGGTFCWCSLNANTLTVYTKYQVNDSNNTYNIVSSSDANNKYTYNDITNINNSLSGKQDTITGAASTVTSSDLQPSKVLVSNTQGKIAESNVGSVKLSYISSLTSNAVGQNEVPTYAKIANEFVDDEVYKIGEIVCHDGDYYQFKDNYSGTWANASNHVESVNGKLASRWCTTVLPTSNVIYHNIYAGQLPVGAMWVES